MIDEIKYISRVEKAKKNLTGKIGERMDSFGIPNPGEKDRLDLLVDDLIDGVYLDLDRCTVMSSKRDDLIWNKEWDNKLSKRIKDRLYRLWMLGHQVLNYDERVSIITDGRFFLYNLIKNK